MPRNRIISQSLALYVGPTPCTGDHFAQFSAEASPYTGVNRVKQLHRIQSFNFNSDIPRQDITQFGELAPIDRVNIATPSVPATFSYYLANMWNEAQLGFNLNRDGCISGILNGSQDDKNYFVRFANEGNDTVGLLTSGQGYTLGIGNGFITSYSATASVGDLPTVSIGVEGLNWAVDAGASGNAIPAINPVDGTEIYSRMYHLPAAVESPGTGNLALSVLRPSDLTVTINSAGTQTAFDNPGITLSDAKIQSFNLGFNLSREPLQKLGSRFAFTRNITFPTNVTLGINAIAGDLSTGSLADILREDESYDIFVKLNKTLCGAASATTIAQYYIKGAKLDSLNFNNGVGANSSVDLNFSSSLGGPNDQTRNLFMSGVYQ